MSGPGQHYANVSQNPNITHNAPPPPIGAPTCTHPPPPAAAAAPGITIEHQQHPIYSPPLPIGIAGPSFGISPFLNTGAFPMDPFLLSGLGAGVYNGNAPLAPIRTGNFLPGAHGGIGFGLHAAGGLPIPPPPPGAMAGVGMGMPFAPVAPLWAGGSLAFGNVPFAGAGMGMMPGMGMGMGMMGGMMNGMGSLAPMHARPAPVVHDGNLGFPAQPEQAEVTQIAGGIPAGVTLVESGSHTIIMQIKGNVCPWLSPGAQFQVEALALGSTTGLNRLIQVLNNGAADAECENMALTECIELGNGMWEKGQTFKYNDAVCKVLTVGCVGWDNKRNRTGGQSLHLWLHRI